MFRKLCFEVSRFNRDNCVIKDLLQELLDAKLVRINVFNNPDYLTSFQCKIEGVGVIVLLATDILNIVQNYSNFSESLFYSNSSILEYTEIENNIINKGKAIIKIGIDGVFNILYRGIDISFYTERLEISSFTFSQIIRFILSEYELLLSCNINTYNEYIKYIDIWSIAICDEFRLLDKEIMYNSDEVYESFSNDKEIQEILGVDKGKAFKVLFLKKMMLDSSDSENVRISYFRRFISLYENKDLMWTGMEIRPFGGNYSADCRDMIFSVYDIISNNSSLGLIIKTLAKLHDVIISSENSETLDSYLSKFGSIQDKEETKSYFLEMLDILSLSPLELMVSVRDYYKYLETRL